jgi:hypothetical protein
MDIEVVVVDVDVVFGDGVNIFEYFCDCCGVGCCFCCCFCCLLFVVCCVFCFVVCVIDKCCILV